MADYDFILDQMVWSYSRIETFERCPKCFYLNYILKKDSFDGAFTQYGSFGHELLEKYFKNELFSFELSDIFTNNFTSKVTAYFPPNKFCDLATKYFEQGKDYFDKFEGLPEEYEILGVEKQYDFKIGDYNFHGVVDLELKHKDGWYEIVDHKSKSEQHKKKSPKSNDIKYTQLLDKRYIPSSMITQLYLYSIPFFEEYKEFPRYLNFNMFRINDWYKIDFNKEDYEKSKLWAVDLINKIYGELKWLKGNDVGEFWCNFVCGMNINCEHSNKYFNI